MSLQDDAIKALRTVHDPEIPINIYDLGLIYELCIDEAGMAHVKMTLTSPACPVAELIPQQVAAALKAVPGIQGATVELVWEPAWTADLMSEAAKLEMEFTGHSGPAHLHKNKFSSVTLGRKSLKPPSPPSARS